MTNLTTALGLLENKVATFKGNFTLNDAASSTGLPVDQARELLDTMMTKYVCRLMVTENGDLIYGFGSPLKRRGEKTLRERLDVIGTALWKAFKMFFKAWITVTLVVYFVLFVVILIAAILAMSQGKDKKSSVNFNVVGNLFSAMFRWNTVNRTIRYTTDRQGYSYRQFEPKKAALNENKKSFIASVYDFVFGPPRVEIDPLNNVKEVAAFVRKSRGIVTPSELVALAGWTLEEAERFLSDCVVRYKGEVRISDDGVVYGRFDDLLRSTGDVETSKIEWFWDEYEAEYEMTGNSSGRNALIVFLNAFNLFMATIVVGGYLGKTGVISSEVVAIAFLGWVPLAFSLIFFLVPIVRWFAVQKLRRKRIATNIRKRIMRVLFKDTDKLMTLEEILNAVNGGKEKPLTKTQVETALGSMMRDYAGEVVLNGSGEPAYSFPVLLEHEKEAGRIRNDIKPADSRLGEVIYDSASTK